MSWSQGGAFRLILNMLAAKFAAHSFDFLVFTRFDMRFLRPIESWRCRTVDERSKLAIAGSCNPRSWCTYDMLHIVPSAHVEAFNRSIGGYGVPGSRTTACCFNNHCKLPYPGTGQVGASPAADARAEPLKLCAVFLVQLHSLGLRPAALAFLPSMPQLRSQLRSPPRVARPQRDAGVPWCICAEGAGREAQHQLLLQRRPSSPSRRSRLPVLSTVFNELDSRARGESRAPTMAPRRSPSHSVAICVRETRQTGQPSRSQLPLCLAGSLTA